MTTNPLQRDWTGWAAIGLTPLAILAWCALLPDFPTSLFESPVTGVVVLLCLLAVTVSALAVVIRRRRLGAAGVEDPLPVVYPFALWLAYVALWVASYLLLAAAGIALVLRAGVAELLARGFGTAALLFLLVFTIGRTAVAIDLLRQPQP